MSLAEINTRIASACHEAGRNAASVTLVAVSKVQPVEKIQSLINQGQRVFGENRVQEAMEKFPALRPLYPDIQLHLIGHLQTNKAKEAVTHFDIIETLDSARLAEALKHEMDKQNRRLPCFLQVNTGEEEQKGGIAPKELETLFRFCTEQAALNIIGLMCLPPAEDIPDLHFALLHRLAADLGLPHLSMGMSADFDVAIRYGATHVRIGSALFGERSA